MKKDQNGLIENKTKSFEWEIMQGIEENEKLKQLEEKELAEKYNPDNLFKKREKLEATTEVSMSEYKELNFIQKLLNKIKSFFRR